MDDLGMLFYFTKYFYNQGFSGCLFIERWFRVYRLELSRKCLRYYCSIDFKNVRIGV